MVSQVSTVHIVLLSNCNPMHEYFENNDTGTMTVSLGCNMHREIVKSLWLNQCTDVCFIFEHEYCYHTIID